MTSQPQTLPITVPDHVEHLLQTVVAREQRRLDQLARADAPWLERWRQRKRVRRAEKTLEWAETRAIGHDAFVIRHGIFREGGLFTTTTALGWYISGGGLVEGLILGVILGAVGGVFAGIAAWDRGERLLRKSLASHPVGAEAAPLAGPKRALPHEAGSP